jgi:O-antigen ligase
MMLSWKNLYIIPFLLVLSTVFVVSGDLANGVVSGKYFWFYGSICLVGIATLLVAVRSRQAFRFSVMDAGVLLLVGNIYLSALALNDTSHSTTKLLLLALLSALYFCFRMVPDVSGCRQFVRKICCIFIVITGLVEAVWGLRQLYGFEYSQHSLFKITGSFFNPGPCAGYLALVFPMALYYTLHPATDHRRTVRQWASSLCRPVAASTVAAILLVLPAAMSRASWVALTAGSLVVILGHSWEKFNLKAYLQKNKRVACLAGALTVFLLAIALTGMYLLKKDSADGRLLTWKVSLQVIATHPFGAGLGNFPGAYGEAQAEYFRSGQASPAEEFVAGNPEYAFNEYLQIAIESGIISLLCFLFCLFWALRNAYKNKRFDTMGALVSLMIFAAFSYPFSVLPYPVALVFLLATSAESTDNPLPSASKRRTPPAVNLAIAGVAGIIIGCCLANRYPAYEAYKKWRNAQILYQTGLYADAATAHAELYPYLNDQVTFLFEYGQSLSRSGACRESNTVLKQAVRISCDPMFYNIMGKNFQALKAYQQAEACYLRSVATVPSRIYPYYLLAKMYHEAGRTADARKYAEIVCTKKPKVPSLAIEEMRNEMQKLITQPNINNRK